MLTEGHELIENMKEDNQKLIGILRLKDSEKKALLAQMQEQAHSSPPPPTITTHAHAHILQARPDSQGYT